MLKNFFKGLNEDSEKVLSPHLITEEDILNYSSGRNSGKRVVHFTHTDIAGNVCGLLGEYCFTNITTIYSSNRNISDDINTFVLLDGGYKDTDILLVSDVSLGRDTLGVLEMAQKKNEDLKVVYVNHQDCFLDYNEDYKWVSIQPTLEGIAQDSASILYRLLVDEYAMPKDVWLDTLVEKSRRYTKWEWKEFKDFDAEIISSLCHDAGNEYFVKSLKRKHLSKAPLLDDYDRDRFATIDTLTKKYIERKKNEVLFKKVKGRTFGFVFAENYINKVADEILDRYRNLDVIVVINSLNTVSYRANSKYVGDIGEVAKIFGGGGDKHTAGSSIPIPIKEALLSNFINLFTEENRL